MARDSISTERVPEDLQGMRDYIARMRADFDSHNHDGANSRSFQTLKGETFTSRAYAIRKTSFTSTVAGIWMGLVGSVAKFALGDASNYLKWDGTSLTIKATNSNLQIYETVVDAAGNGDYTTVSAALAAGKTRIFVRNGTYSNESKWTISSNNVIIEGESYGGVIISFATGASSRNIELSGDNTTFSYLYLKAYSGSSETLFYFATGTSTPNVHNCILENKNGKVFESAVSAVYANIRDCYIDASNLSSATNFIPFYNLDYSTVTNVIIDCQTMSGGTIDIANGCDYSTFTNLRFYRSAAQTNTITNCDASLFFGCYFSGQDFTIAAECVSSRFVNDGNTPTTFFLILTGAFTRFINNHSTSGTSHNHLDVTGANIQCNNNMFRGGQKLRVRNGSVTIYGVSFVGNQWITGYDTAAPNLELQSSCHNALATNNVLRNNAGGATNIPTITDSGTSNTVANNSLILG